MTKAIYYFTDGDFNYIVDENYFSQLLDEDYFLRFDEYYILSLLKETLELEEFFLDDVFDDIKERIWNKWDGEQNHLSKETVDDINKEYNLSLTVDDFGEIMYYDESGGCTEITYTEAQTGEGCWDDDTTVRRFVSAENLDVSDLLNILKISKADFISALKERNFEFGEFIEKIIKSEIALDDFLEYSHCSQFECENKSKQELSILLKEGDYWWVLDGWDNPIRDYPLSFNEATEMAAEDEYYSVSLEK